MAITFKLPYMVLSRDDVKEALRGSTLECPSLTDEFMKELAQKLGERLAQEWDVIIYDIIKYR